jgi:tetratricopeptide (TPR) repeat protein
MGNIWSTAADNSCAAAQAKPGSGFSKDSAPNRRVSVRMVQNVLVIWLDRNIDDINVDCRNTITQLQRVVNSINKYTDGEECIKFLKSMKDEKACMIISGSLGQVIVPRIHNMIQVDSIFIFCQDEKYHQKWAKDWTKIKGVFTNITLICEALKQAAEQCEQNAIPMSFVNTNDDTDNKNLDQLDPSFMYTQILKEILLTIKFEREHIKEFIDHCREQFIENDGELKKINKFQQKYRNETPIWWYTYDSFLYPMLNRALRTTDAEVIIKMGFFIGDLHRDIHQLHLKQFDKHPSSKSFIVYRGQGMSHPDLAQMRKTQGGIMSFNNFLSTSKNREISLRFANAAMANPDLVGILFVMTIDPSKSTAPFASIAGVSYYPTEDEILFSMHTVFRICNIKPMDGNMRLFQVDLTLTCDNDKDLCMLTDRMREETKGPTGWYRLGELLRKIGEFNQAQKIFIAMLNQPINDKEKAPVFNQLGMMKNIQGEFKEAIRLYEKSLEIYGKTSPANHLDLAWPYDNAGVAYYNMGDYLKALSSHVKALKIRQQSLPPNHPDLASSYNNIGVLHAQMGEYTMALPNFEKAHAIKEKQLPSNHPDLASSYDNIGNVYRSLGEYSKALSAHEKAQDIFQRALPANHPDLAMSYNNIALVYEDMRDYSKARLFYERAVNIGQNSLPSNHPELQKWQQNLKDVKNKF